MKLYRKKNYFESLNCVNYLLYLSITFTSCLHHLYKTNTQYTLTILVQAKWDWQKRREKRKDLIVMNTVCKTSPVINIGQGWKDLLKHINKVNLKLKKSRDFDWIVKQNLLPVRKKYKQNIKNIPGKMGLLGGRQTCFNFVTKKIFFFYFCL